MTNVAHEQHIYFVVYFEHISPYMNMYLPNWVNQYYPQIINIHFFTCKDLETYFLPYASSCACLLEQPFWKYANHVILGQAAFCGAGNKLYMLLKSIIDFKCKNFILPGMGVVINLMLLLSNTGPQRVKPSVITTQITKFIIVLNSVM